MAGLYIHIPYCHSKCFYCDFFSTPRISDMECYVDALITELSLRKDEISDSFNTVYIGGGTPSILPVDLLSKIIQHIADLFDVTKLEEFTIEANPEDVTKEWSDAISQLGISRVSMGIQSFVDNELKAVNRRHNSATVLNAINILREANISEISGDLIYGLPNQTLESWKYSLHNLLSLDLPHFSAYLLSYEPKTRLSVMRDRGLVEEASECLVCEMYNHLIKVASIKGYQHYEISNFSKPGHLAIHNTNYWRNLSYLGVGVSAHSYDGKVRRYNSINIRDYIKTLSSRRLFYEIENETAKERHNDYIIVSLRTSEGINLMQYRTLWGDDLYNNLLIKSQQFVSNGQMILSNNHLFIAESSMLISDRIMIELIL